MPYILQSVSKLLDVIHKLSKCIDRKSLETIYESFVRSKLEYHVLFGMTALSKTT